MEWKEFFIGVAGRIVSGGVVVFLGAIAYRYVRRHQNKVDAQLEADNMIVHLEQLFKEYLRKNQKELTVKSHSTLSEKQLTEMLIIMLKMRDLKIRKGVKLMKHFDLFNNVIYSAKGVLFVNNYNEQEPQEIEYFEHLREMKIAGILTKDKTAETYLKLYQKDIDNVMKLFNKNKLFKK